MVNSIEMQIVRLVEEIAKDEKDIRFHKAESITRYSEATRNRENEHVKMYEESLERKLQLLKILKGGV